MSFQAALSRQLALLAEQLTAAAAAEIDPLTTQIADLTTARDRFRARVDELTSANDALSLELEARAAERETADQTAAALEAERERATRLAAQLAALEAQHVDITRHCSELVDTVARLEKAADAHAHELARAQSATADASAAREQDAAARASQQAEIARLTSELSAARATLESETARLTAAMNATQLAAEGEIALLRDEVAAITSAHFDASAARDRIAAERDAKDAELDRLSAAVSTGRMELEGERARLSAQIADARTAMEGEVALLREELAIARALHRDRMVHRLSLIFEDIARGGSIEDVLSAAANGLSDDFSRVAVFAAAAGRLEARYQRGFDPASGVERTAPTLADGSFLARAAASTELGLHGLGADLPFSGEPSLVVTAPILVRGELLALIYADNEGHAPAMETADTAARVADIIRRHAALRLDRLTLELKTIGELRAYAKMLLDEVEYVYRADVSAKKPEAERIERLTENLRCARQIYQQRVTVEGPAMAALLEDVLASTITAKSTTPFGRELASVAAHAHPAAEAPATA